MEKTMKQIKDYIVSNTKYYKDVNNMWCAWFECGDGYVYSYAVGGSARVAKAHARDELVETVIKQSKHPIFKEEE